MPRLICRQVAFRVSLLLRVFILHDRYRKEFGRSIECVRFGLAAEPDEEAPQLKPVLLVKANTLKLKYLIRLQTFRLVFWKLPPHGYLWYGIQIADDPTTPGTLWSVAESEEELAAIAKLSISGELPVFLFNEEDINLASTRVHVGGDGRQSEITEGLSVAPEGAWRQYEDSLDELLAPSSTSNLIQVYPLNPCIWMEVRATLITNTFTRCELSLFTGEEGDQQEALAEWLVDSLGVSDCARNPFVHEESGSRELSDVLLSYENGAFLLESKSLAILTRPELPTRTKLKKSVLKHVDKAASQLRGACANIRRGLRVTSRAGHDVAVTRDEPIHCMILVPDLELVAEARDVAAKLILPLLRDSRAFLNIVDLTELHNLVQNARSVAAASKTLTPIMAFDGILLKRFEFSGKRESPHFRFRMRLS